MPFSETHTKPRSTNYDPLLKKSSHIHIIRTSWLTCDPATECMDYI